jgi:hypothetical protein
MRGLVQRWRELSFEKKLAGVIVPVLVTAISVTVPILAGGSGSKETPVAAASPPAHTAKLQVLDLAVSGGNPGVLLRDRPTPSKIDLTVRNAGSLVSVLTRLGLRVRATGFVAICQAGGGLEPSKNYDVLLPPRAHIGQLIRYKLSQQVAPNNADRFTVRVDVPEPARQLGTYLYQLDVLLFHDQARAPVKAGTVIVAAPFVPTPPDFWSAAPAKWRAEFAGAASGPVKECMMKNEAVYRTILALKGERSSLLNKDVLKTLGRKGSQFWFGTP